MKLPAYKKRRALTLPEKDGDTRMLYSFRDKVMDMGFIIKAENDTYYIYLDDVLVYSLDKGTCKYNRYLYSQKMKSEQLRLLELTLYKYFGPGGKGSSLLSLDDLAESEVE